jgi:DNA-binding NtrC family response regulator
LPNAVFRINRVLMATILIVEDEMFICQNAEWLLRDLGHDVLLACNLEESLGHLSASGPIDALFVDIRLNVLALGGYDIANQAIMLRPALRVLYTSGNSLTPDMTDQFVAEGRFLEKPYSNQQLEFSIGELLNPPEQERRTQPMRV